MSNVVSIRDHIDVRWQEYVEAQRRAQATLAVEDGIAAGRAWSRWLSLYMTEEQKEFIGKARASA